MVKAADPHSDMIAMTSMACFGSSSQPCCGRPSTRSTLLTSPNWGLNRYVERMPVAAAEATNGTKIAVR